MATRTQFHKNKKENEKKNRVEQDKDNSRRVFYGRRALSFHVIAMYSQTS